MEPWLALWSLIDHPPTVHHSGNVSPFQSPSPGLPSAVAQWPQGDEWGLGLALLSTFQCPVYRWGGPFPHPHASPGRLPPRLSQ